MSKIILNVKTVLQKFERIPYEDKVISALCRSGSKDYVLLVTAKRLVLAHVGHENAIFFESIYYEDLIRVEVNLLEKNNYLGIIANDKNYALSFARKEELLVIRSEISLHTDKNITTVDSTTIKNDPNLEKKIKPKDSLSPFKMIKNFFITIIKTIFSRFFIIPALLLSLFIFAFFLKNQKLNELDLCRQQIELISTEVKDYSIKNNKEPDNVYDFIRERVKIKGVKDTAKDPWDNLFTIREKAFLRDSNIQKKAVISYGPDRKPDTEDDIVKEFDIIQISQDNTKVKK